MEFVEFVRAFGEKTGLGELKIDADNHVAFTADEIPVHLLYVTAFDSLLIFSELIDIPPTADANLYRELLEMNYLFEGTQGATLSKEPETEKLILTEKVLHFSSFPMESIVNLIEHVVDGSEKIIALLKNYRGSSTVIKDIDESKAFFNGMQV